MFTRHPQLSLIAYSDGTSAWDPNICTHDLSCCPQGPSVEKYSDTIVSAHGCESVCFCKAAGYTCVCVCACVFSRYFTSSFTTTHTPSHQGAKQNNGAGQAIGLAGVSLLSVSLCLCSISLSSLFKIINVVHILKTMEKPTTVGLRRVKLTQKWQHEKLMTMWIRKTKTKKHTDYMFLFSPCNIQYRLFFLVIEQILVKFPVSVLLISICIKMPPVCIFFILSLFSFSSFFSFSLCILNLTSFFWGFGKKSPWCTLSSFQTHWDTRIHKFSAHPTNLQAVHLGTALTLAHANTHRCNTHSHSPAYESMVHTIKKKLKTAWAVCRP